MEHEIIMGWELNRGMKSEINEQSNQFRLETITETVLVVIYLQTWDQH